MPSQERLAHNSPCCQFFLYNSGVTAVNIPPGLAWIEYIVYLRYSTMAFFTVRCREYIKFAWGGLEERHVTHLRPCLWLCRRNSEGSTFIQTVRKLNFSERIPSASLPAAMRSVSRSDMHPYFISLPVCIGNFSSPFYIPSQIIEQYDMDLLSVGESVAVLASLFSVMWVGAYIALRRVAKHGSA